MKKELKDYAHFYLGCEFQLFLRKKDGGLEFDILGELITVQPETKDRHPLVFMCKTERGNFVDYDYAYSDVKPILRPLSDMTDEEENAMIATQDKFLFKGYNLLADSGETFRYMLSRHFDLFGLIESGLAISKPALQKG